MKGKQFDDFHHSHLEVEQREDMSGDNVSNYLPLFLDESSKDHRTTSSEFCRALRLSLDPAKVVLDAMLGSYPSYLKKGVGEFEVGLVRSSILLLEQVMGISPRIQP